MDYKKKSLNKLSQKESYEEIDTRLASGWYVDAICLLYTSPSPRDVEESRMPSSA